MASWWIDALPQCSWRIVDHVATLQSFPLGPVTARRAADFSYAAWRVPYMPLQGPGPRTGVDDMSISVRRPFGLLLSADLARDIACAAIGHDPMTMWRWW